MQLETPLRLGHAKIRSKRTIPCFRLQAAVRWYHGLLGLLQDRLMPFPCMYTCSLKLQALLNQSAQHESS